MTYHEEQQIHLLRRIEHILRRSEFALWEILRAVRQPVVNKAKSLVLKISVNGATSMGQPVTIHVSGQGATASIQEFDGPNGTGNPVPAIGPVVFASDNPSVATVDPSSGAIVAVSVGTANIAATDQGNSLTDSVALTVTAAVAQSLVETVTPNNPPAVAAAARKA